MYKIKAIVPNKKPWQLERDHKAAILDAGAAAVLETQALFLKYIANWKATNRPKFRLNYKLNLCSISTTAKVFVIQNNGVDHSYTIKPKKGKFLRFKPKHTGKYVFARMVKHPGFKAQKFDEQAYNVMIKRYPKLIAEELDKLT